MSIPHTGMDYIVSPGDILADIMESRRIDEGEFAACCGQTIDLVSKIVSGEAAITEELALTFGRVLEMSPEMWVNLENNYRDKLSKFSC